MNKQCGISNYRVRLHAACFKIFPISNINRLVYSIASHDVLVKVCLVVPKLGFIQVCILVNLMVKQTQPKRIQYTEVTDVKDDLHNVFQTFAASTVISFAFFISNLKLLPEKVMFSIT